MGPVMSEFTFAATELGLQHPMMAVRRSSRETTFIQGIRPGSVTHHPGLFVTYLAGSNLGDPLINCYSE